jgi:hypothetical protein
MRVPMILLAAATFGLAAAGPAGAQVSDQCNYYPNSPGCPMYRPGQGLERSPRVGPTYRHEAPQYHPEHHWGGGPAPYRGGGTYGGRYYDPGVAPRGACPPGYEWRSGTGRCYRL